MAARIDQLNQKLDLQSADKLEEVTQKLNQALELIQIKDTKIDMLQKEITEIKLTKPTPIPRQYSQVAQQVTMKKVQQPRKSSNLNALSEVNNAIASTSNSKSPPKVATPPQKAVIKNAIVDDIAMIINDKHSVIVPEDANEATKLDETEFKTVTYKKKRPPPIKGSGPKSNELQCAESKVWIFLGR